MADNFSDVPEIFRDSGPDSDFDNEDSVIRRKANKTVHIF